MLYSIHSKFFALCPTSTKNTARVRNLNACNEASSIDNTVVFHVVCLRCFHLALDRKVLPETLASDVLYLLVDVACTGAKHRVRA